ncbi:hypothetical protein F5050DRAFT_1294699 [Lentinula boryana]|uniref:Uncharacterized protein n=1 Tax=Lentinula boryana TaxID=40481 RepID=A0ABQ8QI63_9AGAR|nr:hypothetical protein F5050DRAFT_1294699 [Lentinula boryana]
MNSVLLYQCSWCNNPSAVLKKCSGCFETSFTGQITRKGGITVKISRSYILCRDWTLLGYGVVRRGILVLAEKRRGAYHDFNVLGKPNSFENKGQGPRNAGAFENHKVQLQYCKQGSRPLLIIDSWEQYNSLSRTMSTTNNKQALHDTLPNIQSPIVLCRGWI